MAAHYSPELVRITQALIASSPDNHEVGGLASVKQLTNVLGDRMFSEVRTRHKPAASAFLTCFDCSPENNKVYGIASIKQRTTPRNRLV
jgi:hypothetical protein